MIFRIFLAFICFSYHIYHIRSQLVEVCRVLPERPLGMTDQYNGIKDSQIKASSSYSSDTEPKYGRLHYSDAFLWDPYLPGAGAWVANVQNTQQYIEVDLLERKVISSIATQGRQGSREFVKDYYVEYSDGEKANYWVLYRDKYGKPFLFDGNVDDNSVKINNLTSPIIARHVRIKPQRWNKIIALRFELFGCKYIPWTATFDGKSQIVFRLDSPGRSVQTAQDRITFRFKTQKTNGLIFYAEGGQGDFMAIELFQTKLTVKLNLGYKIDANPELMDNNLEAGSMLDDDHWHDVEIHRTEKDVNITLDRVKMWRNITADFIHLNLNRNISLGGLEYFSGKRGISGFENFVGCIEDFIFNGVHMIRDSRRVAQMDKNGNLPWETILQYPEMSPMMWWGERLLENQIGLSQFATVGNIGNECPASADYGQIFTFPSVDTFGVYITIQQEQLSSLIFSCSFRTFKQMTTFFYHHVDAQRKYYIHLGMEQGYIVVDVLLQDMIRVQFFIKKGSSSVLTSADNQAPPEDSFADGIWHSVRLYMDKTSLTITADNIEHVTKTKFPDHVSLGQFFYIGGGKSAIQGFQGCMKNIIFNNKLIEYNKQFFHASIENGTCSIFDRCTPNPCKHEAPCTQDGKTFFCNCSLTGYQGAVCHRSDYATSCSEVALLYGSKERVDNITIDVDGSGVLPPFVANCVFLESNIVMTELSHNYNYEVRVEGYLEPQSFRLPLEYRGATREALNELTRRATSCEQSIAYKCYGAKLLKTPSNIAIQDQRRRTWGSWIGRRGQMLFYWGGGIPGRQLCECGVEGTCTGDSITCNCDAEDTGPLQQLSDTGTFTDKNDLPVMEVRLGDTSIGKDAKYSLLEVGPLRCIGDTLFDNTITFTKSDSNIKLPPLFAEDQFDMMFMFRTTIDNAVVMQTYSRRSQQFFEVRIREGNSLRVSFNVGQGVQIVEVISAQYLNDNAWHIVRFERNRKESVLILDQNIPMIHYEDPDRPYETFNFGDDPLTVGSSQAFTDGYLGCFSNLIINGVVQDLIKAMNVDPYGLKAKCKPRCDEQPCLNRGECYELYSHYYCECGLTPYRGYVCGREVGASFDEGSNIVIELDMSGDNIGMMEEYFEVGFKTKGKKGTLLYVCDKDNKEYIHILINTQGGITLYIDVGFKRQQMTTDYDIDFTSDQHHTLRFWRSNYGRIFNFQVDNYKVVRQSWVSSVSINSDTSLDSPKFIYVGRSPDEDKTGAFIGCLYRMQLNNIFPLKLAFSDTLFRHKVNSTNIRESKCGFEEIMPIPDPVEVKKYPPVPTQNQTSALTDWQRQAIIVGVVMAIIILALVILLIVFFRYFSIERGDYDTREAKGADEMDTADDAIRYGKTGQPEVSGKEWWI